jgi:glycosyltransferase involved in cell wall biosynthesis
MRVALVVHGLPPHERTGVEVHTEALARALARSGIDVHVFAPRASRSLAELAERREAREGFRITWIALEEGRASDPLEGPRGIEAAFRAFLEREQIDLVHFQHIAKLGARLIETARASGRPVLYTAHDWTPLGPNPTLLLPDLSQQTDLTAEGYGRWWSARAFLDGLSELGDHHGSAREEELSPAERRELADRLGGRGSIEHGLPFDLEQWRELFRDCDRLYATSRTLASRLSSVLGTPVEHRPAGIDARALAATPPVDVRRERLRFGYLGALIRPKGVHVLLDAFESLREVAELEIHGDSRDERTVRSIGSRAREVGARMAGGYRADELRDRLARLDVIVVPSLWSENAPFAVREAFAARRPVIASRTDALGESVRDGVDGLLFEAGSPGALRAAMLGLVEDRHALARLIEGITPVRRVEEEAAEYAVSYRELLAARTAVSAARRELPEHVRSFAARHAALRALPTDALCARAIEGMRELERLLGAAVDASSSLPEALAGGTRSRDLLYAAARETEWLRESMEEEHAARASEERRAEWLAGIVRAQEEHVEHLEASSREAGRAKAALEREREWLSRELTLHGEELAWRARSLEEITRALDHAREGMAALDRERAWLREVLADRDRALDHAREELEKLASELAELGRAHADQALLLAAERATREELEREARWRASEMEGAREAALRKLRARLAGGELVRRVRAWPPPPDSTQGDGA